MPVVLTLVSEGDGNAEAAMSSAPPPGGVAPESVAALAAFEERRAILGMFDRSAMLVLQLPPSYSEYGARGCGMDVIQFWQPVLCEEDSDEELVEAACSGIVGSEEERAMLRDDAPPVAQPVLPPVERGEP